MTLNRRAFGALTFGGLGAAFFPAPVSFARVPLQLEKFFIRPTRGVGTFVGTLANLRRDFTVDTVGQFDGRTLVLKEAIVYADGARENAEWRFVRTGSGRYLGRRTGVDGIVPISSADGIITMGYVAEVTGADGKTSRLRFDDILEQLDANTVLNTANVSFLGLSVGRVEITFKAKSGGKVKA
jgi:hypothetical protein